MERPGIYCILNCRDGKRYIGSSIDAVRRLYVHRYNLRRGQHHSPRLQRAYDRDGEVSFSFAIIERCGAASLLVREQLWIEETGSAAEYNVCPVAGTRAGVPQPASVAVKMALVHAGKPKTPEHRAKIAAARKGQIKSDSHRQKLREAALKQMADPFRRAQASAYATAGNLARGK